MFEDDESKNLLNQIILHYRQLFNVANFNDPKDRAKLERQVKFDLLEKRVEDSPWR